LRGLAADYPKKKQSHAKNAKIAKKIKEIAATRLPPEG